MPYSMYPGGGYWLPNSLWASDGSLTGYTGRLDLGKDARYNGTVQRNELGQTCYCAWGPGQNIGQIARALLGHHIDQARSTYPNVRAVIENGEHKSITQDYNPSRINVETANGVIIKIMGLY